MIRIWIDADSCPSMIRNFVVEFGILNSVKIIFVANKHVCAKKSDYEMIICNQSKDAADNYIFENADEFSLVITRDILLAERLVSKGIKVINDRGMCFTKDNIHNRLEDRDLDLQLSLLGFGGGTNSYGEKQFAKFKKCFDIEFQHLCQKSGI